MKKEKTTDREFAKGVLFAGVLTGALLTAECPCLCLGFVVLLGLVVSKMDK